MTTAAMSTKVYNFGDKPGCVTTRRSRVTGGEVSIYHNPQAGIVPDDKTCWWSVRCEDHGTLVGKATLSAAEICLSDPMTWCEKCKDRGKKPKREPYKSRATRASEQASAFTEAAEALRGVIGSIEQAASDVEDDIESKLLPLLDLPATERQSAFEKVLDALVLAYGDDVKAPTEEAYSSMIDGMEKDGRREVSVVLDASNLRPEVIEEFISEAQSILDEVDASELESLTEEMTSWRDNMQGTGLENTDKYSEVEDAASTLEGIDAEMPSVNDVDDISMAADELDSKASELEGVSFPGMF